MTRLFVWIFLGYNAQIIQRSDNTCELTINEPLKKPREISTGNINVNYPLKDIYNKNQEVERNF